MQGIIIESSSNIYQIISDEIQYEATPRGKLKKQEITPVVGDKVEFEITDKEKRQVVIEKILPREVFIKRPKLANITQLVFVISSKDPKPDLLMLDKQLAFAEWLNIKAVIVLNKIDLDEKKEFQKIKEIYQKIGYPVIETRSKTRDRNKRTKRITKK